MLLSTIAFKTFWSLLIIIITVIVTGTILDISDLPGIFYVFFGVTLLSTITALVFGFIFLVWGI